MDVVSPVEPQDSDPHRLAAYFMGRHPGFVRAWQVNLGECARLGIDWGAIDPICRLWPEIAEEPAELEELDDLLRDLTVARKADVGILVELHRAWDSFHRTSTEIVEAVSVDDRAAVVELCDYAEFEYRTVNALSELLVRGLPELNAFQQLGAKIGKAVELGSHLTWMAEQYYLPTKHDLPSDLQHTQELLDVFVALDQLAVEVGLVNPIFKLGSGVPVGVRVWLSGSGNERNGSAGTLPVASRHGRSTERTRFWR